MAISLPSIPWPFARSVEVDVPSLSYTKKPSPSVSLRHYSTPGVPPPSARVDPRLRPQAARPVRLWDIWKYGAVFASKVTEVTTEVVCHTIWGPRKKSWGIEMTLITSLMRGISRHSALVDIGFIRTLITIGGLVPLPSDALVTPVTFRVRKRKLRGILSELDAQETGTRELSGEWVVGKRTWKRLQAEWKAGKTQARPDAPQDPRQKKKERVVLYIHGGAYYLSSAAAQRILSIPLSKYIDARVFALDYRLAPETRFPGPLHDVVSGYLRLVEELHIPPENIIIAGDSAGGGLSLALLMYLRDNDYPLPSSAILMSPWVDLTMSCESWDSNVMFDVVPFPELNDYKNPISLYLGDHMEQYLTHPYASPLFGDFKGLPPMLIQAGDAEVLRDEITLLAHKATLAGVEVRHELYEDAVHVFQLYPFLDLSTQAFLSCREFVKNILPQIQSRSPQLLDGTAEAELEQEIDNEKACLVRGDGVKTACGIEEVKHELEGEPDEQSEGESQGGSGYSMVDFPSWGRSQTWLLPSPPGGEDSSENNGSSSPIDTTPANVTPPPSPSLRRIRSALSLIMPDPIPVPVRHHHRARTGQYNFRNDRLKPNHIDIPDYTMTSFNTPPPSPTIRRSNPSHPDITSLVEQWNSLGPANQTLMYKPHAYSGQ